MDEASTFRNPQLYGPHAHFSEEGASVCSSHVPTSWCFDEGSYAKTLRNWVFRGLRYLPSGPQDNSGAAPLLLRPSTPILQTRRWLLKKLKTPLPARTLLQLASGVIHLSLEASLWGVSFSYSSFLFILWQRGRNLLVFKRVLFLGFFSYNSRSSDYFCNEL